MIVFGVWVCRYNHFKAGAQGRHTAVTDVTVEHALPRLIHPRNCHGNAAWLYLQRCTVVRKDL